MCAVRRLGYAAGSTRSLLSILPNENAPAACYVSTEMVHPMGLVFAAFRVSQTSPAQGPF
jgi:hypothetical protein